MGPTPDVVPVDLSGLTVDDLGRLDNPALQPVLLQAKKYLDGGAPGSLETTQFDQEFYAFSSSG